MDFLNGAYFIFICYNVLCQDYFKKIYNFNRLIAAESVKSDKTKPLRFVDSSLKFYGDAKKPLNGHDDLF